MSNPFHILLEVRPRPAGGLSDEDLLTRIGALYPKARVEETRAALRDAREGGRDHEVERIHRSYEYRTYKFPGMLSKNRLRSRTCLNVARRLEMRGFKRALRPRPSDLSTPS